MASLLERWRPTYRSLRFRLMVWNVAVVAVTSLLILLAVRQGMRYMLVHDLDRTLAEDIEEIELYFDREQPDSWAILQEELNRKAVTHDYHGWFVKFFDAAGQPVWSSDSAPTVRPIKAKPRSMRTFTERDLRVVYYPLKSKSAPAAAVAVGCRIDFIDRDISGIDRLIMFVGGASLLISPLIGFFLTNRAIRPLTAMIRTTAKIHPGATEARVPVTGTGDELDRLAETINGLLNRIADYLAQEHDFLANAAHELRTPLSAIRSSAEVALGAERSMDEHRDLLALVIEQCSTLETLVNQLLLLAEVDADRLKTDAQPVALNQLVAQSVEMFRGVAELNEIAISTNDFPPANVLGNCHHMRQVLNNLLDNAIKFSAAKHAHGAGTHATIYVELLCDDESKVARLCIKDNGVGIPAGDLPHVFDRFYRVDKSRARDRIDSGTGLGLSICKAIVEAHHGSIAVESANGDGTSVIICLPLQADR